MIPPRPLELWGGAECTVNRVRNQFFDQYARSGHLQRHRDFERFASIGFKALRYGLNWERYAATGTWKWFDTPLAEMRRLGMEPIAGLVHHGSGPADTGLLDPAFPGKLAAYAGEVAQRYPWVRDYTPVNEPQTTARFSGLYGHWYPHHTSMRSFVRALFHELQGTVLAMRAIREVRSDARLVQTEDIGRTWSTSKLQGKAGHREQRRWLAFDLLCGRVDRHHSLFGFLRHHGLTEAEIFWFLENPCPPDILGVNYYVTSDRFLDHRLALYPGFMAGGDDGREPLVDIEAVRIWPHGIAGAGGVLMDAWKRYRIPVALTEAHLGAAVDEQIRWLAEAWHGAEAVRSAGGQCLAVCVWALLGSYDWCHLVTRETGAYEPGVFCLSSPEAEPVETELARVVRQVARGEHLAHPALGQRGWWTHTDRLLFPSEEEIEDVEFTAA